MRSEKSKKLLVIEDDTDIRELLKVALSLEGYDVDTACNGKEAWELLVHMKSRPSVLVLDLMMPIMDGWQFLDKKNNSGQFKDLPTLIISATSEKRMPIAQGNTVILKKPIDLDEFLQKVQELSEESAQ